MKTYRLRAGDTAPQFVTRDSFGKRIELRGYRDRHVLVVFMRYSACPWCNLSIHRLSLEYSLLRASGCEVIAFVQSSAENIRSNIYDKHMVRPEYPIIPDPEQRFYKQYGVTSSLPAVRHSIKDIPHWLHSISDLGFRQPEVDGNLLLVPASFLIAPGDQQIIRSDYASSFYQHQTFTHIYELLNFH